MPRHDLHNHIKNTQALAPQSITSNTTTVGTEIDLRGYEAIDFAVNYGALNAGTFTPLVEESDVSGSGYTAVADADLLGLEADAANTNATPNLAKSVGYRGGKRYVRLSIVSTGASGANIVGATAVLGGKGNTRVSPDGAVPG